ncbi:MAG: elongation factor P [Chloroflexi bacterium]|nr:elongation factor P [Chloroflexota bacterium]
MYTVSDLRKGLTIVVDGEPYVVTSFEFVKPGKGQALYRTRLRNMLSGVVIDKTYRSGEALESASLEQRKMQYLYKDEHNYYFMDTASYEQVGIAAEAMGDAPNYLIDNLMVDVLFFRGQAIGINVPTFVNLHVTQSAPWAKGDTSGADSKVVTVETGYQIRVPPFVQEGDLIQIDTRTGTYITRVKE